MAKAAMTNKILEVFLFGIRFIRIEVRFKDTLKTVKYGYWCVPLCRMENLKRKQLFEFEDQAWFPSWARVSMTKLLVLLNSLVGVEEVLAQLLAHLILKTGHKQLVDLGSGAGGPTPKALQILKKYDRYKGVKLLLTDLYPDADVVAKFNTDDNPDVLYHETPVDASDLTLAPDGLKIMVNSFHHLNPIKARKVLQSAFENKQSILIYEMGQNNLPFILWVVLLPISMVFMMLMVWVMTPFVKPSIKQLLFTYLIPLIPIFYAWDGQASIPRIYPLKDVDKLLAGLSSDDYLWENKSMYRKKGKKLGTYIMGIPQTPHKK
jgi:hypothetical protein